MWWGAVRAGAAHGARFHVPNCQRALLKPRAAQADALVSRSGALPAHMASMLLPAPRCARSWAAEAPPAGRRCGECPPY